jgi:hypothetical protein
MICINAVRHTPRQVPCMTDLEYLRDRSARLHDLARRAHHREHLRYLVWRAAEAANLAEALEQAAKAKPDEAGGDAGGLERAC